MKTRLLLASALALISVAALSACGGDDAADEDLGRFADTDSATASKNGSSSLVEAAPGAPGTSSYDTDVPGGPGDAPLSAADISRKIIFTDPTRGMRSTRVNRTIPLPLDTAQVRDAQMITQHAFMGDITYQNAGAMLFGHKPLPGYL